MRVYANLLGQWVDITETGTIEDHQEPTTYFEENLCYKEGSKIAECFKYGYVNVQYDGRNYRISPSCIQLVT